MILQILNIAGGFLLCADVFKKFGATRFVAEAESMFPRLRGVFGLTSICLGVLGLLVRMDIVPAPTLDIGASYPQAVPAILIGCILFFSSQAGEKYVGPRSFALRLRPYERIIGILGMAVGIGSMVFGCVLCMY